LEFIDIELDIERKRKRKKKRKGENKGSKRKKTTRRDERKLCVFLNVSQSGILFSFPARRTTLTKLQ
jgi:hypothetical protein